MKVCKYPVLAWEDSDGGITASLVEFPEVAAFGETLDDVLLDLKEFITWSMEHEPWNVETPDFLAPEIFTVKVPVRAEYQVDPDLPAGWTHEVPPWLEPPQARRARPGKAGQDGERRQGRVHAAADPIMLRVVAVRGHQEGGLVTCALPMLGITFSCRPSSAARGGTPRTDGSGEVSLRDLVIHYVQDELGRKTPRELSRHLAPRRVMLEQIQARWPRARSTRPQPDLPDLSRVASAMGDSAFRRAYMRSHGRAHELESLRARLLEDRSSIVLVGPPGCGKTSLMVDAVASAERHATPVDDDDAPPARRRFWMTSAGQLIAGMRYLGQWQERCERIVEQLQAIRGVLCVERLLDLVRVGGCGASDSIGAFLAPYLERGEMRMVVEATPDELDACRRLLPGFVDLFRVVKLEPFAADQEPAVLAAVAQALERQAHVAMAEAVPATVARLFRRVMPTAGFPGSPVAFLRSLATNRQGQPRPPGDEVSVAQAQEAFCRETGLPPVLLQDDLTLDEEEVSEGFRSQVVGQEEACAAATRLVMTFKAGLHDPGRPLGVLLFCGPTGVGKTEMARALARAFFGANPGDEHGEKRLVRLDMSEYAGPGAADRLLGATGEEPGVLVRRLREQPFSVVLLDEIEKADPEIFDLLLGVLDEGRLKDSYGRVTSFRSAIIVMTSNLGDASLRSLGISRREEPTYEAEALRFFRPEFFNRLDAVVRFHPLSPEHVRAIARKELEGVAHREGLEAARIRLEWTPAVEDLVVRHGYDASFGARPLQRAVDTHVVTPLARFLAMHPDFTRCTLRIDADPQGRVGVDLG